MFNFPFVEDSPQLQQDTLAVFSGIKNGRFIPYTSTYTYTELANTRDDSHRARMLSLIPEYDVTLLEPSPEAERLASLYLAEGAVPVGFYTDAIHIAMTAVYCLDCIVSLNFRHIAREWTIKKTAVINEREGYPSIHIYKPAEVLHSA